MFFKSFITFKKMETELDKLIKKDMDIVSQVDNWIVGKFFFKYHGFDDNSNPIVFGFINMKDDYDYWYNMLESNYVKNNYKLSTYIRSNLDLIYYEGYDEELERINKIKEKHYGKNWYRKKVVVCKCDIFKIDKCKCK